MNRQLAEHRVGRLDVPGAALAAAGFGMLTYGIVEGAPHGCGHGVPLARGQHDLQLRAASIDAFRVVMLVSASLALAGAVIAALGISNADARRAPEQAEPAAAS